MAGVPAPDAALRGADGRDDGTIAPARPFALEALGIEKSFGATTVLKEANLRIARGEIHALLGGNGAGKSTLIRIISGSVRKDGGTILVDGAAQYDPTTIAVVFQELALLPDLTVAENIHLPHRKRGFGIVRTRSTRADAQRALAAIDERLAGSLDRLVKTLDLHQRQLIEIARALSSGAKLLLLDEPTANLTFAESERLFSVLRRLTATGISILIVSHRMSEIRMVADVCTILRDGCSVVTRRPLTELTDDGIVEAMGQAQAERRVASPSKRAVAKGVTLDLVNGPISLRLAPGSVLGLAGAPDGPADLINALVGARRSAAWSLAIDGKLAAFRTPGQAVRSGVGYVSGDRAEKGILATLPIMDNIVAAARIARRRWLTSMLEARDATRALERLAIKASSVDALPQTLSGGTQQKLLIARWLDLAPKILVLEEPTRGVDVGTKRDIYDIIQAVAAEGTVVIWWSTEFSELAGICDHVIAFDLHGSPSAILARRDISEVAMARATGMAA